MTDVSSSAPASTSVATPATASSSMSLEANPVPGVVNSISNASASDPAPASASVKTENTDASTLVAVLQFLQKHKFRVKQENWNAIQMLDGIVSFHPRCLPGLCCLLV